MRTLWPFSYIYIQKIAGNIIEERYQIGIIAFEIEDFDGNNFIERNTQGTMNRSTDSLAYLLEKRVMLRSNRILLLLHDLNIPCSITNKYPRNKIYFQLLNVKQHTNAANWRSTNPNSTQIPLSQSQNKKNTIFKIHQKKHNKQKTEPLERRRREKKNSRVSISDPWTELIK